MVGQVGMHGQDKLTEFTDYINSLYPTIKFKLLVSQHQLNVLDLTMHLDNDFIETVSTRNPPTAILFSALQFAPLPFQKSIPFNVAIRLKRNCSSQFYERRKTEYASYLVQQGYSDTLVKKQFDKVHALSRDSLIHPANVCKSKLSSYSLCT